MLCLDRTAELEKLAAKAIASKQCAECDKRSLKADKKLSIASLRTLSAFLKADNSSSESLYDMCRGSRVTAATSGAESKEKSPAEVTRLERLRTMQAEKNYQNLVGTIAPQEVQGGSFGGVMKEASVGFNMIFATFTAIIMGYYLGNHIFQDEVMKLATGLVFGIIMMVIEMILFIARASIRATQEKATEAVKKGKKLGTNGKQVERYKTL